MTPLILALSCDVSKKRVWQALVDPAHRNRWWAQGVVLEPSLGGRFEDRWTDDDGQTMLTFGKVVRLREADWLTITWQESHWLPEQVTEVTWALEGEQGHCRIEVTHVPTAGFTPETWQQVRADFIAGWSELLQALRNDLHGCEDASTSDIIVEQHLGLETAEAFSFWSKPERLSEWLCAEARLGLESGGAFELRFGPQESEHNSTLGCQVVTVEGPHAIAFQWRGPAHLPQMATPGSTMVFVTFVSSKKGTLVRLVHTGFGVGKEWQEARHWQKMAWQKAFRALQEVAN